MTSSPKDGISISISVKTGVASQTVVEYISPIQILQCSGEKELSRMLHDKASKMIASVIENHYEDD